MSDTDQPSSGTPAGDADVAAVEALLDAERRLQRAQLASDVRRSIS